MALVTKNDVTQIFAIQAPSIDLPPTFANYPRGWDVARTNNGKPTIKQFNYIQQRTDQNLLWIHQNGAALPYDAAMEYAENAHVVKDGVLQKKQGAGWVIPYLGKSNNLDDMPDKATARNNLEVMSATEVNTAISNAIPPTTPDATEIVAGKAKIATTAIAQEGANDTDFITALKLHQKINNVSFGINQVLSNPTTLANTWYTNTSGKVMFAHKMQSGTNHSVVIKVRVESIEYSFSSGSLGNNLAGSISVMAIIPIGAEYQCNYTNMIIFS